MTIFTRFQNLRPVAGFRCNVGIMAAGTVAGKLAAVVAAPFLTRCYSPQEFGTLAGFLSIVILLATLGTFQYYQAIPLPSDERMARNLVALCFAIMLGVTLAIGFAVILLDGSRFHVKALEQFGRYSYLVVPAFLIFCLSDMWNWMAVRKHQFKQLAGADIARGCGTSLAQILLGAAGLGAVGLILGDIIGRAGALALLIRGGFDWKTHRHEISPRHMMSAARRYWRFALMITPSNLLNRMCNRLPVLLILSYYGPLAAGSFALTEFVLRSPITLLGSSIGKAYLGEASQRHRTGDGDVRSLFFATSLRLGLMGIPPLLVVLLAGPYLFALLFGSRWTTAGEYAQMLAIGMYFKLIASTVSQTLHILERQHIQALWDVGATSAVVGSLFAAWYLGWNAQFAVGAYAIAMALSYLVYYLLICHSVVAHHRNVSPPEGIIISKAV